MANKILSGTMLSYEARSDSRAIDLDTQQWEEAYSLDAPITHIILQQPTISGAHDRQLSSCVGKHIYFEVLPFKETWTCLLYLDYSPDDIELSCRKIEISHAPPTQDDFKNVLKLLAERYREAEAARTLDYATHQAFRGTLNNHLAKALDRTERKFEHFKLLDKLPALNSKKLTIAGELHAYQQIVAFIASLK